MLQTDGPKAHSVIILCAFLSVPIWVLLISIGAEGKKTLGIKLENFGLGQKRCRGHRRFLKVAPQPISTQKNVPFPHL